MRKILAIALVLCLFAAFTVGTAAATPVKNHVAPKIIEKEVKAKATFKQNAGVYGNKLGLIQVQGLAAKKDKCGACLLTGQLTVATACGEDAEIYSTQEMSLELCKEQKTIAPVVKHV
jgi:hypothetical protein